MREKTVVPHAGTWIEIMFVALMTSANSSFPTRERGLKYVEHQEVMMSELSFPTRERGLKSYEESNKGIVSSRSPRGNVD